VIYTIPQVGLFGIFTSEGHCRVFLLIDNEELVDSSLYYKVIAVAIAHLLGINLRSIMSPVKVGTVKVEIAYQILDNMLPIYIPKFIPNSVDETSPPLFGTIQINTYKSTRSCQGIVNRVFTAHHKWDFSKIQDFAIINTSKPYPYDPTPIRE
jgi:hypothetical protein